MRLTVSSSSWFEFRVSSGLQLKAGFSAGRPPCLTTRASFGSCCNNCSLIDEARATGEQFRPAARTMPHMGIWTFRWVVMGQVRTSTVYPILPSILCECRLSANPKAAGPVILFLLAKCHSTVMTYYLIYQENELRLIPVRPEQKDCFSQR